MASRFLDQVYENQRDFWRGRNLIAEAENLRNFHIP